MEKYWTLYKHVNKINGKVYIGITSQTTKLRWLNGRGYKTQMFGKAIKKYGWDNFEHIVINNKLTEEQAKWSERQLIIFYRSNNPEYGYNIVNGGEGNKGIKLTEKQKEHLKQCAIKQNKEHPITEEQKAKCREASLSWHKTHKQTHSEKTKEKLRQYRLNQKDPRAKKVLRISTNTIYNSAREASEDIGKNKGYVSDKIVHNDPDWKYID